MKLAFNHSEKAMGLIQRICAAIEKENGRAFLVGGLVRDQAMVELNLISKADLAPARDFDIEAYQITAEKLHTLLSSFGRVDTVGEAFTVYKLGFGRGKDRIELDVSLPRRESKTGKGHRGFTVTGDPSMTIEEAARRRDFTINAIMCNPLTGEILDPYQGIEDLKTRSLRVVDPKTFIEDSLRVLRAMQFAARFEFTVTEDTKALCQTIDLKDLPCERILAEIEKLLLRAKKPSIGWQVGLEMGVIDQLFPELKALVGCPQEKDWHPEGDVWVHTLQAIDEATLLINDLPKAQKITVMLAVLFHDLGKPSTTKEIDGRIRSLAHEEAGVKPTEKMLDRLNIHTIDSYHVREQVIALVANHLKPGQFYKQRDTITDGAFRRLARKCEMDLLYLVAKADSLGRHAIDAPEPNAEAQEWFRERVLSLGVEKSAPEALLLGRHLLELGLKPGRQIGEITRAVYELQLDGKVTNLAEAINVAKDFISKMA
ncbi:MAG: HD domain-containing protein [Acidobacteria bacterium]|nr:HD domain-containing protein [Acidobacteriota bacterium]